MPDHQTLTGRCLCGAVTIVVTESEHAIGACHCRMCQRWSGAVFAAFDAPAHGVTVTGDVRRYRSSSFAERAFCPACGSHLWLGDVEEGGEPETYELMPGLFDEALSWPLRSEVYADRAMASMRLGGEHRRRTQAEYEASDKFVEGDAP